MKAKLHSAKPMASLSDVLKTEHEHSLKPIRRYNRKSVSESLQKRRCKRRINVYGFMSKTLHLQSSNGIMNFAFNAGQHKRNIFLGGPRRKYSASILSSGPLLLKKTKPSS